MKLKDYLDGATVQFDAAGNVVDGRDAHRPSATEKMLPVPDKRIAFKMTLFTIFAFGILLRALSVCAAKMAALHTAATSAADPAAAHVWPWQRRLGFPLRRGRGFGILIALNPSDVQGRFREFRQAVWLVSRMARKKGWQLPRMSDVKEILTAFEQALELERELGTRVVECDRALLAPVSAATSAAAPAMESAKPGEVALVATTGSARSPSGPSTATSAAMPTVAELAACTRCELHGLGRTHVVPGQGNADSPDFMFVGEAPGADEDRQGLAFVGAAGQLLTKMIAAMGYTRDQVFIANICKCRPPSNRTPSPQEMAACVPYLKRQIALVRPKCLVLLGNTAMRGLFPDVIMRRGQWRMYGDIPAIGTFHPAYVLRFDTARDPAGLRKAKLEVWNTLKLALARLGKTPPAIQRKGQTT